MSTLLRVDTLIEILRAQLEHGGMTYEEAVVNEEFLSMLEQTRARVSDDDQPAKRPRFGIEEREARCL